MTRRGYIRISSYIIFALSVLVAFAVMNTRHMENYKNQLEVSYQQSLNELSECIDTVNTDLTKSLYSNSSSELHELSRDLFAQCSVAKNAVSRLPVSQMELGNTYKFLSQASDYAQYIGAKVESGATISEQEHKNLASLLKYAEQLKTSTQEMVSTVTAGARITDGNVKNGTAELAMPLSNSFSNSAKTFESFPTLLYDGPFSDQVLNKKSELISNSEVVNRDNCLEIAAKTLGVSTNKVSFSSDEKSKLPCYTFKSGRYTISVTKQGGYIKNMLYSGAITKQNIDEKSAVNKAKMFLNSIGYTDMNESYFATSNNVCTINFAYTKNNIFYYSDLIKVGVSLDSGKVISLDAATYLTNHTDRANFKSKVALEDTAKKLSPYLKINSNKKCVIPKENGTEKDCYEFAVTSKDTGEDALIYVNASTGEEEDIMLLLYTDNGTLVK